VRFRNRLVNLAKTSGHHSYLHSVVIARGKSIVSEGINTDARHAEIDAIYPLADPGEYKGATLYTLMIRRKSGTIGNGAPCPECMRAIRRAGIKRVVVYT
jgi:deoxycytidylate deaminase